jgi:hypothetical protein
MWTYQVPSPAAHVVDGLQDIGVSSCAGVPVTERENAGDERQEGDEEVETHFRNVKTVILDVGTNEGQVRKVRINSTEH